MLYDNFQVGEIILTPFPFTDLSAQKTRPAVVLSTKTMHQNDIIIGALSSKKGEMDIEIWNTDLESGTLPVLSYFKIGKLVTLDKNIVKRVIGKINSQKTTLILQYTKNLF